MAPILSYESRGSFHLSLGTLSPAPRTSSRSGLGRLEPSVAQVRAPSDSSLASPRRAHLQLSAPPIRWRRSHRRQRREICARARGGSRPKRGGSRSHAPVPPRYGHASQCCRRQARRRERTRSPAHALGPTPANRADRAALRRGRSTVPPSRWRYSAKSGYSNITAPMTHPAGGKQLTCPLRRS